MVHIFLSEGTKHIASQRNIFRVRTSLVGFAIVLGYMKSFLQGRRSRKEGTAWKP